MPDGSPLTLLESGRELDHGDLTTLYAYPADQPGPWVRANFITSADGGATAEGTSGTLAGPGDKFIFNLLRELADVIVVGAGTVRIEGSLSASAGRTVGKAKSPKSRSSPGPAALTGTWGCSAEPRCRHWCSPVPRPPTRHATCSLTSPRWSTAPAAIPATSTRPPCWRSSRPAAWAAS